MQRLAFILFVLFGINYGVSAGLSFCPKQPIYNSYPLKKILNKHFDQAIPLHGLLLPKLYSDSSHKRIGAVLLAIPLGLFGLHRLYLGTKPFIPIVYIATFGGGLGILPFIDFMILVLSKDIEPYIDNPKIFMWNKE